LAQDYKTHSGHLGIASARQERRLRGLHLERSNGKTSILKIPDGSGPPRPMLGPSSIIARMKARQCEKLRDLRQALIDAGFQSIDHQATALGLGRSTAWAVLQGHHKASGLSAAIVSRMMASSGLPQSARSILLEYIQEKSTGAYGHNGRQLGRFLGGLNEKRATEAQKR
jgi:hypothetical protein